MADHDRRFEETGAIAGAYCLKCFRPCIPHPSGKCRTCRPKALDRVVRKLTPEDEERLEKELAEVFTKQPTDPADRNELEARRREVDADRAARGTFSTGKNGHARRRLSETDRAIKALQAKAREAEIKPDYGTAVCANSACKKTFEKKRILQECCSRECGVAIQKVTFKVSEKKVDGYVPGVPVPGGLSRAADPGILPVPAEAPRSGGEVERGELEGTRGPQEGSSSGDGDAEDETVKTEPKKKGHPSRFNENQLAYADTQNRPPHNRSHGDIAKELGTAQAHLSRLLKEWRAAKGLDEPDVMANRRAAREAAGETPKKKAPKEKKMPATQELRNDQTLTWDGALKVASKMIRGKRATSEIEALLRGKGFKESDCSEIVAQAREKLGRKKHEKGLKHVVAAENHLQRAERHLAVAKRHKPEGKIVGISLEGVVADAERAKQELSAHKEACADCAGAVSSKDHCLIGRALSARWARLEFIAVSA